jgi:hypothetical protein
MMFAKDVLFQEAKNRYLFSGDVVDDLENGNHNLFAQNKVSLETITTECVTNLD